MNIKLFNKSRNNKPLDLSLTIRFANIPNNAHFDLKSAPIQRKESKITLAVQLESGDRKIDDFDSNQNLWDIIQQLFANNPVLNYGSDMNLCIVYMRKEVFYFFNLFIFFNSQTFEFIFFLTLDLRRVRFKANKFKKSGSHKWKGIDETYR